MSGKTVFLGSIYPQFLQEELTKRKQFVDYPANVFQHSLLKGLEEHFTNVKVITSPVIRSSYSSVRDLCRKAMFSHARNNSLSDTYVGTLPIPVLQIVVEFVIVFKALKKELKQTDKSNYVIIYALHSPFLLASVLLKKYISCSCVVVPDLPQFMTSGSGLMRKFCKQFDRVMINFCVKRLDCFALLSPYMRDKLPIAAKPWVLMEGIFDVSNNPEGIQRCKERVVFYGGNLSRRYGIMELLEAFRGIEKENYRLWICGSGDGKEDVQRMAEKDNRVQYFGIVSHQKVLELQQRATVLINPRSSEGEYTKYSFPSKTMEYLASGTPTIMCHLPAIPAEYNDYLFYITDESAEGIRKKIMEVCEKPQHELDEFGMKASEFIRTQKNAFVQAKKVVDLIHQEK